jgi:hypothetical protein
MTQNCSGNPRSGAVASGTIRAPFKMDPTGTYWKLSINSTLHIREIRLIGWRPQILYHWMATKLFWFASPKNPRHLPKPIAGTSSLPRYCTRMLSTHRCLLKWMARKITGVRRPGLPGSVMRFFSITCNVVDAVLGMKGGSIALALHRIRFAI